MLAIVAGVVAFFLVRTVRRTRDTLLVVALSFVLAGALGNLIDRIFRSPGFLRGAVVDFVHIGSWPTFNVADSSHHDRGDPRRRVVVALERARAPRRTTRAAEESMDG